MSMMNFAENDIMISGSMAATTVGTGMAMSAAEQRGISVAGLSQAQEISQS